MRQQHIGSYYATAGLGYGVDISHYGAPYKGMLGVGLGQATWSPAAGQSPSDDPRMVRQYAVVRATYQPVSIAADKAARAADLLLQEARRVYAGNTVRKIGSTGWTADGMVGFEVILAQATRAGEIKQKDKQIGLTVGPRVASGTSFENMLTHFNASDLTMPSATPPAPSTTTTPPEGATATTDSSGEPSFFEQRVAGLPVWAVGIVSIAAVGGVIFLVTRKPKSTAVAANRRRYSGRRRRKSVYEVRFYDGRRSRFHASSEREARRRANRAGWWGSDIVSVSRVD